MVEIWLTSEDTGAYGRDIGVTLPDLLNELIKVIPEGNHNFNGFIIHRFHVKKYFFPEGCRLRLGMTNPPYILDHLEAIAKIMNSDRVYKFLHVPIQSGSDVVLGDMKREYTADDFSRVVNVLRQKVPGITIGKLKGPIINFLTYVPT